MTTSPVMTITDELLAELEAEASAVLAIRTGHCRGDLPIRGDSICMTCGASPQDGCRRPLAESYAQPQVALSLLRHIAELKEQCAALERDAGRYAWIRDQHNDGMGRTWVAVYQPGEWVSLDTFVSGEKSYVLNLDMAVDAAIQSQGEMT